jgi:hypothetical protein
MPLNHSVYEFTEANNVLNAHYTNTIIFNNHKKVT